MTLSHGFELLREADLPDINSRARFYRHVRSGAELLSLENDDENKCFGITFRTPPADSTGIAHILEHSVLCGSRKYPIKEPFVELIKGSLKTFLNALTFPDKTAYPVASTNLQDFYNLVDVYLDAVLHPRITPQILQQEGWHYELDAPDQAMTFKGVVYNEMKGANSSPERVLYRSVQRSLFGDHMYGNDSGGDPQFIPDLTYAQFKAFHAAFYHPANARIFFYGDDPPEERLRLLDAYLSEFEHRRVDSQVPLMPRGDELRRLEQSYAVTEEAVGESKGMFTLNWLLDEVTEIEDSLALSMLSYCLVGTPAAALRKALLDSGLGEDLAGGGVSGALRQPTFSIGLKGIDPAAAPQVEALILETLTRLADAGIDPDTIEAAFNSVEFSLRENNTGSFPRGLALMFRALGNWIHDRDPLAPLALNAPLAALRRRIDAGEPLFSELLRRNLLENGHRSTVLLCPDPELGARLEAAEQERLSTARAGMDDAQIDQVIAETAELRRIQETPDSPEALAGIPGLTVADLDREIKTVPTEVSNHGGAEIVYHDLFTTGIVYFDLGLNMHQLPQELLPYLPLFGRAMLDIGTHQEDEVRLAQRIGRHTGGVYLSSLSATVAADQPSSAWFLLRGKATIEKADEMLAIMRDMLLDVRLDNRERMRQIVLKKKAGMEAGLVPRGNAVVGTRLGARFTETGWLDEQTSGISYLFFLRELARQIEQDWPAVLEQLEAVKRLLVNRNALFCNVTLDGDNWRALQGQVHGFIEELPAMPVQEHTWQREPQRVAEGLLIPAQINYVGWAGNLAALGYEYHGSAAVITRFLRTSWLWEKIRVQGGAYGAACGYNRRSGVMSFTSYRDPNLLKTLDVYRRSAQFLRAARLENAELQRHIIGAIGDMDAYKLPDAKGYSALVQHLVGISDAERQQIRNEIFATDPEHFRAFAEVLAAMPEQSETVVMGASGAIAAANREHPGLLQPLKVL
jgi:presequence protease